jgi:hypothetical protein
MDRHFYSGTAEIHTKIGHSPPDQKLEVSATLVLTLKRDDSSSPLAIAHRQVFGQIKSKEG